MDIIYDSAKLIVPGCCPLPVDSDDPRKHLVVVSLGYMSLAEYEGRELTEKPVWLARAQRVPGNYPLSVPVTFCPHCGQKLPEVIALTPEEKPAAITHISDGGYH